jgi:D-alanyl-D-alanine carboxypeptidase
MRIVEPRQQTAPTVKKKRFSKKSILKPLAVLMAVSLIASVGFVLQKKVFNKKADPNSQVLASTPTTPENTETPQETLQADTVKDTLRNFSANEFKLFYDNLRQPNLEPVENSPIISGNDTADARIRDIAEKRGYRLRSSPSVTLTAVDGERLQAPAAEAWLKLKEKAVSAGHTMSLVSGYRSESDQRALFLSRLAAAGATIEEVANGKADDLVNKVLITSSIPGYSKHHTGYTFDLQCAGYDFENFKNSPCHDWMAADNYKIAKEFGFIPSYPDGADAQGPDPEAWEYVYVGTELLYE